MSYTPEPDSGLQDAAPLTPSRRAVQAAVEARDAALQDDFNDQLSALALGVEAAYRVDFPPLGHTGDTPTVRQALGGLAAPAEQVLVDVLLGGGAISPRALARQLLDESGPLGSALAQILMRVQQAEMSAQLAAQRADKFADVLRIYACDSNWRLGGICDPQSPNCQGPLPAQTVLGEVEWQR